MLKYIQLIATAITLRMFTFLGYIFLAEVALFLWHCFHFKIVQPQQSITYMIPIKLSCVSKCIRYFPWLW